MGKHRADEPKSFGTPHRPNASPNGWDNARDKDDDAPAAPTIPQQRGTIGSNDPDYRASR